MGISDQLISKTLRGDAPTRLLGEQVGKVVLLIRGPEAQDIVDFVKTSDPSAHVRSSVMGSFVVGCSPGKAEKLFKLFDKAEIPYSKSFSSKFSSEGFEAYNVGSKVK